MDAKKIIFITGTDTGVGKTLLTALLLNHLRMSGIHALAMKPFCSGDRADVKLLQSLQRGELSDAEMNPFYFDEPIAPLVAAQKNSRTIRLREVIARIQCVANRCDCLLVEGSGGLLVPLGKGYMVADLIAQLDCSVIVVARNRLGTINHTLLTISALCSVGKSGRRPVVVLMDPEKADLSSSSNKRVLAQLLKSVMILKIPFLGKRANLISRVKARNPTVKKVLTTLAATLKSRFR